jgi:hypothetical protein
MPAVAIAIDGGDALSFETTWCSEAAAGGLQLLAVQRRPASALERQVKVALGSLSDEGLLRAA